MLRISVISLAFLLCATPFARSEDAPQFDRDVRPILKLHCSHCHGESEELAGGLDVRLRRRLVAGGESGAAVEPEHPQSSLLLQRIVDGEMPPEDVEKRPTSEEIAVIRRWIEGGAPVESDEPAELPLGPWISRAERQHWSFQPLTDPPVPADVARGEQARQPSDLFLLRQLEPQERGFAEPARRAAWLRRVSFDLTGLPPGEEQLEAFLADRRPGARGRQVDRLLASPAFGERWGRFWLDVAGYADSEGRVADPERPDAWRYRDYVVSAFNQGLPYDQFVIEQLAGDELVSPPYHALRGRDLEKLTATGFLRMAADGSASGANNDEDHNQVVADTVQIVGSALLGLTVQCAQCHNHRYDPIPQADYYRLRAVLDPALNWKSWKAPAARRVSLYSPADKQRAAEIDKQAKQIDEQRLQRQQEHIERVFQQELAKLPAEIRDTVKLARDTPVKKRTAEQKKLLAKHPSVNVSAGSLYLYDKKAADELKKLSEKATALRATKPKQTYVRALTEPAAEAPPTFVFIRGDFQQPGEQVRPGGLGVLGGEQQVPAEDESLATSGRRLNYARWLVGGEHPLTARAAVNRIWQHLFGRGIVETPGDFGLLGARPSHPRLLDHLATRLQRDGWEIKPLIRQLVLSAAYAQTSREAAHADDPQNKLLGSMPLRRLDAEAVRDGMLAAAGLLNLERGGPPVPVMADRVGQFVIGKENLNAGRPGALIPMRGQEYRRSLYIQVRRSRPLAVLDAFDLPPMAPNCHCRPSSTAAPQSLLMMNSDLALRISRRFAQSVIAQAGDAADKQAAAAWRRAYGEAPTAEQLRQATEYLTHQRQLFVAAKGNGGKKAAGPSPESEALATFCQALLGSNRFLYLE